MTHYYEIHVEIPKSGYSIGIDSAKELTEQEAIEIAILSGKFEEKGDEYCVDSFEEITPQMFLDNGYSAL